MATRSASVVNDDRFKIFSGTANPILAESICRHLDVPLGKALLGRFSDGEIYFQILENVRGADVFVVQPCHAPVDCHLLELLLMIDAFKRASAWRITAVLPYYCYARQDRKDKPRVPISAKLVADLLETAGASRALKLDLHAPQIQGYLDARGAFWPSHRAAPEVQDHRSRSHGFRAAQRSGKKDGEDQGSERCRPAGARNSLDSRRDFHQ